MFFHVLLPFIFASKLLATINKSESASYYEREEIMGLENEEPIETVERLDKLYKSLNEMEDHLLESLIRRHSLNTCLMNQRGTDNSDFSFLGGLPTPFAPIEPSVNCLSTRHSSFPFPFYAPPPTPSMIDLLHPQSFGDIIYQQNHYIQSSNNPYTAYQCGPNPNSQSFIESHDPSLLSERQAKKRSRSKAVETAISLRKRTTESFEHNEIRNELKEKQERNAPLKKRVKRDNQILPEPIKLPLCHTVSDVILTFKETERANESNSKIPNKPYHSEFWPRLKLYLFYLYSDDKQAWMERFGGEYHLLMQHFLQNIQRFPRRPFRHEYESDRKFQSRASKYAKEMRQRCKEINDFVSDLLEQGHGLEEILKSY